MAKIKVGLIGTGVIGKVHLKAIQDQERFERVGLTDAMAESRQKAAEEFNTPAFESVAELIEQGKPDYVVIATPHKFHADIACDCLRAGVHAFIEKPVTVSADNARRIRDAARETGKLAGVNFLRRIMPNVAKFKELLDDGFVGNVTRVTVVLTEWFRTMFYYNSGGWRGTWNGEGGGVIVNQAPHDLDLICWALGLPTEVCAEINTFGHDIEVEDDLCAILKWPNGAMGTLQVNTNEAPGRTFMEVTGTTGTLTLTKATLMARRSSKDTRQFSDTVQDNTMTPPPAGDVPPYELAETKNRYLMMHENFADAIETGAPLVCPIEDALQEVELANALLVSGMNRRWTATPAAPEEFAAIMAKLEEARSIAKAREAL